MGKKEFAAAALDLEYKTYIVHIGLVSSVASHSFFSLDIYPSCKPQIAGLIAKEAFTKIFAKYLDFANAFSLDLTFKFSEHTGINNHVIELVNN